MSRFAVFSCLAVLAATGCGAPQQGRFRPSGVKALAAEPEVVRLGDVPIRGKREFCTRIVNQGAATVAIKDVRPNCSCTEVKLGKTNLAPGEATILSGVYEASSTPGSTTRRISIVSASGESLLVRVEANRIRTIQWEPEVLTLRPDLVAADTDVGRFVVSNDSDAPIHLTSSTSRVGPLAVQFNSSEIPRGGKAEVAVTAASDMVQNHATVINLNTSHARESRLELPVEIQPKYSLDVDPEAIHLGVVSKSELLAADEIHVKCKGTALGQLNFVEAKTPSFLDVHACGSPVPQSGDLRLTVVDKFLGSDLSGVLELRFRHSRGPISVEVPVTGFLMDVN